MSISALDDIHECRTELTLAKARGRMTVLFARSDSSSAALVWTGELFTSSVSLAWPNEMMLRRHDAVSSPHVQSECLMLRVHAAGGRAPIAERKSLISICTQGGAKGKLHRAAMCWNGGEAPVVQQDADRPVGVRRAGACARHADTCLE